jgi:coenzyme F420-reducing hydrogenase beta subunit
MENCELEYGAAARLKEGVLDPGLCSGCGACVGFCPYIKSYNERVAIIHNCQICEGVCYRICPRGFTQYMSLRREVFGEINFDQVLGVNKGIYFARSVEEKIRFKGQYGGVVSALSAFALKENIIDSILMTGGNLKGAKPVLVSSSGGVDECAGSKYTASPTLRLFQEAVKSGYQKIGIVGRPCQVTASRKMQQAPEINGQRISLVIGLFCMGAFSPEFYSFIREKKLDNCDRMDIPNDVLFQGSGKDVIIPFEEMRKFIRNACLTCYDPLSELADVSVGSTEYDPGWNALIIRTQQGAELVEHACSKGYIEIKPYPPELLPVLKKAVFRRKKRVLERPDFTYLNLPAQEREYFLSMGDDF